MKKYNFIWILLILFFSCEKESLLSPAGDGQVFARKKMEKIEVCHYDTENGSWVLININGNAVDAHKNHGDVILVDEDEDGFFPNNECDYQPGGDCNDMDASVYPGAPDTCLDGVDQNCDGKELPCFLTCDNGLDCCFCDVMNQIEWTDEAFYCREEFYSGTVIQYYLCPDEECVQWVATVIYLNYPLYNYCYYSLTGEYEIVYFDSVEQAMACKEFITSHAEALNLTFYCIPHIDGALLNTEKSRGLPLPNELVEM